MTKEKVLNNYLSFVFDNFRRYENESILSERYFFYKGQGFYCIYHTYGHSDKWGISSQIVYNVAFLFNLYYLDTREIILDYIINNKISKKLDKSKDY